MSPRPPAMRRFSLSIFGSPRWPWGEKPGTPPSKQVEPSGVWRDAATVEHKSTSAAAQWVSLFQ